MRIFEIPNTITEPLQFLQDAQYNKGCGNDPCYFHPYSQNNPLWFQFPFKVDFSQGFVVAYNFSGVPIYVAPIPLLNPNDYVVGEYACGGSTLPITVLTNLPSLPTNECFFLAFELYEKGTGTQMIYISEPLKPVELEPCKTWYSLAGSGDAGCGCYNEYYGKIKNVEDGNASLQMFNTITLWGGYKKLADSYKYEINEATNKKKSTTTFERYRIGSSEMLPDWVQKKVQSIFDSQSIILAPPNSGSPDWIYFNHSDDEPFKNVEMPCSCFVVFDTVLEKELCKSGAYCSNDGFIGGCTSPCYHNYDPNATFDDGSCEVLTCEAQVTMSFMNQAYWQGVVNNLLLPDGGYFFVPDFRYETLCNCAESEQIASNNGVFDTIPPFPVGFDVVGGVITTFTQTVHLWTYTGDFDCPVNLNTNFTNYWYFGILYQLGVPFPSPAVPFYDWATNPNGLALPYFSITRDCL